MNSYRTIARLATFAMIVTLSWLLETTAYADITVDPNISGATDVVQDPVVSAITLVNPIADPLDLGNDDLSVGETSVGELSISNGGSLSNRDGIVGNLNGSDGTVVVNGAGSTWNNDRSLLLGILGSSSLTIENQGSVNNDDAYLSSNPGSTGTATITGAGSTWISRKALWVGVRGMSGELNILNGGLATSVDGNIGNDTGSIGTATVAGLNAKWQLSQSLLVGISGNGTLSIENQGVVESHDGFIGDNLGSYGMATVTGPGSKWMMTGDLIIADVGTGTLNIENGGTVTVAGSLELGTNGVTNLLDGALVAGEIDESNGAFHFTGGKLSVGTFTGNLTQSGGSLAPGNSPGSTTVTGNYDLDFGQYEVEIGGLLEGTEYDSLNVLGDFSISNGDLNVSLINGFNLGPNQQFDITNVGGSRSGMFSGLGEGAVVANLNGNDLYISYSAGDGNDIILYTVPEPSSWVLLLAGGGLATLLGSRQRKK